MVENLKKDIIGHLIENLGKNNMFQMVGKDCMVYFVNSLDKRNMILRSF